MFDFYAQITSKIFFSYSVATCRNSLPYKARRSLKAASQNAKCHGYSYSCVAIV